jgi:hypothetical protein
MYLLYNRLATPSRFAALSTSHEDRLVFRPALVLSLPVPFSHELPTLFLLYQSMGYIVCSILASDFPPSSQLRV